jgi:toxin FitB
VYLVDTNVISAGVPSRLAPSELITWMDAHSAPLFLSAVTVVEIEDGIAKLQREGATRKSEALATWLETVPHLYGGWRPRLRYAHSADRRRRGGCFDTSLGACHGPQSGVPCSVIMLARGGSDS